MKRIAVIAYDEQAAELFASQLSDFFSGLISVEAYYTGSGELKKWPAADLVLLSTDVFDAGSNLEQYPSIETESVEIAVTFTKKSLEKLGQIAPGTKALFVSSSERMCTEAINKLHLLGIKDLNLIPYYPGDAYIGDMRYAITPGESRFVPECIQQMIDIGARLLDANTIIEVTMKLGLDHMLEQSKLKNYFSSLADNTYSFDRLFERSIKSEKRLDILLDILPDGIIGVDENNVVFAYNTTAEKITGISRKRAMGTHVGRLFSFIPFAECRRQGKTLDSVLIRYKGTPLSIDIDPIEYNHVYMGMFATIQCFNDQESKQNKLRSQLRETSQRAKYTFSDIVGNSTMIRKACSIAYKMAQTNSSVLIYGESGTGKELFAHAIHNASGRKDSPFIAINCAALPESLLESELFGYDEGAFTGAKKGGKMGLFEFAHSGSIFLDEVEGMSPALQVKLLRVLQEKEIMHVGGNGIIHIDVRVIATSNERLDKMVDEGRFRSDLYYRLNTLPIHLPPLRERTEDIPELLKRFKNDLNGHFTLDSSVWSIFDRHAWKGNIRELRNCVEYLTFLGKEKIYPEDLPPAFQDIDAVADVRRPAHLCCAPQSQIHFDTDKELFVLRQLYDAALAGRTIGRDGILAQAKKENLPLSQQHVRQILMQLQARGLVRISLGRGGSRITEDGIAAVEKT